MQTQLSPAYANRKEGQQARDILQNCVHCGFCTATCPTYQVLGDELDSPRGRIYLIKEMLEGTTPTRKTQLHLDRCLTCRNCESTCPSGVQYGQLIDIGRQLVDEKVERPAAEQALRWSLKEGMNSPLFAPAMKVGQLLRNWLPKPLQAKVPLAQSAGTWPARTHARRVLMLSGCVQPAMMPNINSATARVLDAAGVQTLIAANAGCCGAVKFHLNDQVGGKAQMRANIDAWWPFVQEGVHAIVMNASGCGVLVKDYAHHLADDSAYAEKAQTISALTRDLSELLPDLVPHLKPLLRPGPQATLTYHPPCTLQHGQQLRGGVEQSLRELGFSVQLAAQEAHLCCGSAGTYSVLQPEISRQLRDRKLQHLQALPADAVISANIGCISHLQSGTDKPVRHWIEVLDAALNKTT